jgi:hypothetical protein
LSGKYFAFYEEEGVGVQWNNIHLSPVENDQYNATFSNISVISWWSVLLVEEIRVSRKKHRLVASH